MRAIVYLRVSSDEQAESRAGLDGQLDACRAFAERSGWDAVGPFADEAVGGAAPLDRRPGLLGAMGAVERGDVLLVAKRDRLGRDPIVVAMIEAGIARRGGRVVSAAGEGTEGDGPSDILMRRIVDAFAEYERLVIKARTRAALQAKRRRGERVGTIPFGYEMAGGVLVPVEREQRVLARVRRWRAGGWSLRRIAAGLTARGVPTKTGRSAAWTHTAVAKLLEPGRFGEAS